jgi:UMF1 family MFS transporter
MHLQHEVPKGDKRTIRGWVFFDWANSAYQLTITATIFPIYYNQVTKFNPEYTVNFFGLEVINTALYSWALASAFLIMAVFSPIFSSIADYTGRRKAFMRTFTIIGSVSCGMLFFFTGPNIEFGIIFFTLAMLGYTGSIVFYNSFLPVIAEPQDQDKISARGFSMGYIGSVILLLVNLLLIQKPEWFGIEDPRMPARLAFLSVFLWWFGFSKITFNRLPKYTYGRLEAKGKTILNGYRELQKVFNQILKLPYLRLYLTAYFFVMMGMQSVIYMAAVFGQKQIGLKENVLIPTILTIQLIGIFGAWFFSKLSGAWGNLKALFLAIVLWMLICAGTYYIYDAKTFVIAACFIGIVMGGSQALSRSTFSKMIPETRYHTSFFSFYDVMEKLASVAGLFAFGIIETVTGSMKISVLSITLFFFIGLAHLFLVIFYYHKRLTGLHAKKSI